MQVCYEDTEKIFIVYCENVEKHAPDMLHSTDFFCLLFIFYSQYIVYSIQQLDASRMKKISFRTRITGNHATLLNCVT